jgi:pimeloyl-ACP methyl ester carboxylesterase
MYTETDLSLFPSKNKSANDSNNHIVIPTSVEHHYEHREFGRAIRNALYIKKYNSTSKEQEHPVVFFHGGPGVVNEEQFSIMQNYFTDRGHTFYIPEVEGSKMYSEGALPKGFDPSTIHSTHKLLEIIKWNESGLNEFTKNYVDDIKDVLAYVSEQHPGKKINVITHSLGGHQVLRALQHVSELSYKIEAVCNVAGVSNMGASRFLFTLNKTLSMVNGNSEQFYKLLNDQNIRFFKSKANENQVGLVIDNTNNPSVNQRMNAEFSVIYGDLTHLPPILFLHALDDNLVAFQGTIELQKKIQENNGIAHILHFPKGGHQFIKNEGDEEIRSLALEKMNEFFKQPTKDRSNDLSQLTYDDVLSEFKQFHQDPETYLNNKFPQIVEANLCNM